jgi:hypothetical protein
MLSITPLSRRDLISVRPSIVEVIGRYRFYIFGFVDIKPGLLTLDARFIRHISLSDMSTLTRLASEIAL